ncbi:hypothetical protein [Siminovitchia sp. FSL W7-1587]|uniref:hypothetical protein n=1 Tax=Siminovitchia sp. FSL W7-1587 TaxID=2954699 RepID=UPI0030CD4DB0
MVQKGKKQYRVTTGDYENKTGGLHFGYEYSSGNRLSRNKNNEQKAPKEKSGDKPI